MPAVLPRARAHVDEPVGRAHHLLVVLDHEHGVAEIAQALECPDQLVVVPLVKADRRLVQDVEHADELGADLRRQPQPLCFPSRQRRRGAVELQVADADVVEKHQALADLLHDARADELLGLRELELVQEFERTGDGHLRELVNVLVADRDGEHLGLQAGAVADRAWPEGHVLLDAFALRGGVGLAVAPLEARDDALEGEHVGAAAVHPVAIADVHALALGAVEEQILFLLGQVLPGLVERDLVALGDRLDDRLVEARIAHGPRHERALGDRQARIGNEQVRVDLLLRAQTGAARTRAVGGVEGEDPRLQLRERDAVVGTRELLAEEQRAALVDEVDRDEPLCKLRCGLDGLREPRAQVGLHREPVDDHLDRVLELLVERDLFLEQVQLAVHLHAGEALVAQLLEDVLVLALPVTDDRGIDGELRPLRQLEDLVDDRLLALARDRLAADRAVRPADPRVEKAQVVVDLGDRAHRRARVPRGRLLVDRDRRREPFDRVDVGLLHHLEELARVSREAFDVAPLALRIDRVEGQRRLAGAREPGDADQLVPGQPDVDVLEVVLPGTVDDELFLRHNRPSLARRIGSNKCSFCGRQTRLESRKRVSR